MRDRARARADAHVLAHVGVLDARLAAARALLAQLAADIDAGLADAERMAAQARTLVELTAREVLEMAARSLGAHGFCRHPHLAQLLADLPVYLSQSHAERDWARLGELACGADVRRWEL